MVYYLTGVFMYMYTLVVRQRDGRPSRIMLRVVFHQLLVERTHNVVVMCLVRSAMLGCTATRIAKKSTEPITRLRHQCAH